MLASYPDNVHGVSIIVKWYFKFVCSLFHIVLLRCCLSRPDLRPHFAKLIDRSAYGRKNFRISPSWAVYRVEHMVNVSIQILLRRVPSCEESLVEDQIT